MNFTVPSSFIRTLVHGGSVLISIDHPQLRAPDGGPIRMIMDREAEPLFFKEEMAPPPRQPTLEDMFAELEGREPRVLPSPAAAPSPAPAPAPAVTINRPGTKAGYEFRLDVEHLANTPLPQLLLWKNRIPKEMRLEIAFAAVSRDGNPTPTIPAVWNEFLDQDLSEEEMKVLSPYQDRSAPQVELPPNASNWRPRGMEEKPIPSHLLQEYQEKARKNFGRTKGSE